MKTYIFKVIVEPDEDRWHAYCPILEKYGAITWGYTQEEALKNIQDVVEMVVEELIEDHIPVSYTHLWSRRDRCAPRPCSYRS